MGIRSKLMIFFFPESSYRAAARGTVPDRFWLIPEEFLMNILTVLRKSGLFVKKKKDFLKKSLRKLRFLPRGERDTSQPLKNIKITFKKRKRTKKTIFQNLQTGNVSKTSIFQKSQNFKIQKRNE